MVKKEPGQLLAWLQRVETLAAPCVLADTRVLVVDAWLVRVRGGVPPSPFHLVPSLLLDVCRGGHCALPRLLDVATEKHMWLSSADIGYVWCVHAGQSLAYLDVV